jgi:hypothetical protein
MNDDIIYELKKPYFKKKSYISESKKNIKVNLDDVKINNINKISSNSNALKLKIYINKDNINIFKNIDENFLLILKKNNNKWFSNNLKNNELIELFNYSFCSQTNTIDAILSNKSIITYNNVNMEISTELINILEKNKNFINITVSHIGLYIFKEKIQNKWLINNISIFDNAVINDFTINKEEIDKEWENTLNDTITNLNELIDNYENNKVKINNFININLDLIKEIKNIKNTDKTWENKISILKNNIKNILSINDNR